MISGLAGPSMHTDESGILIHSGDIRLEGRLHRGGLRGALLCHPHPLYGGSMENNVVIAAASVLQRNGWTTLRFNFRGVGRSEGTPGDGLYEVEDVTAALRSLKENTGIHEGETILVGYSFGAWVGLRALMGRPRLMGWVAIAPPLGIWDFPTSGPGLEGVKLVVAGSRDPFCPLEALNSFFNELSCPKQMATISGGDHFLWGREAELEGILEGWLRELKE